MAASINGTLNKQITWEIRLEYNGKVLGTYRYNSKSWRRIKINEWKRNLARITTISGYCIIFKPDEYVSQ